MIPWYDHNFVIYEEIADTKSELAALHSRNETVKAFLRGEVKYLDLIKHQALAQGNQEAISGIETALASLKQLFNETPKEFDNA